MPTKISKGSITRRSLKTNQFTSNTFTKAFKPAYDQDWTIIRTRIGPNFNHDLGPVLDQISTIFRCTR